MKLRSYLLIILSILVFGYIVVHVIVNKKLHRWIDQEENICVERTKLNLLMGNLNLKGVKLNNENFTTDTCTIQSIHIKGFSIFDYLVNDEININSMALQDAQLHIKNQSKIDASEQEKKALYVSNISLENADLNYAIGKIKIQAHAASANLSNVTNANKFEFEDIFLSLKDFSFTPQNGVQLLSETIELNSDEGQIKIDNFQIEPQCGIDEFSTCQPNKKARISYKVESIIGKLDENPLFSGIYLEELELNQGLIEVFSFLEMEPNDKPKLFFMEQFDDLDFPVNIPSIKVKNHAVEVLLKGDNVDTISFKQIYSTIANVTNLPEILSKNNEIKVSTTSKLMGTKLSVDFDFKIKDPLNAYGFKLGLEPLPFAKLNKALNYNTNVVIEKGTLQQLDCEVTGNTLSSNGNCDIVYKDLHIILENKKGKEKKLLTKVLNFIVRDGTGKRGKEKVKNYERTLEREEDKDYFFQTYTIILQIIRDAAIPL